jgi:SAM-dependent methyltransferase
MQEYARMYESDYFEGDEQYGAHVEAKIPDFRAQYDLLERFPRPGNRLLEVGCATGQFLQEGVRRGWQATGIEVSRWAASRCRQVLGPVVIVGRFEDLAIPPNAFDVMVMTHVLEHLESPRRALRRAWSVLVDGGLLLVEVPNQFGELWFRAALPWIRYRAATRRPMLVHTHFFLPTQFVRLVESCGFTILGNHTMRQTYPPMKGAIPGSSLAKRASHLVGGLFGQGPICCVLARKQETQPGRPR